MKNNEEKILSIIICHVFDLKKTKQGTKMVAIDAMCNAITSKN